MTPAFSDKPDQPICPARARQAPERPPKGVGMLIMSMAFSLLFCESRFFLLSQKIPRSIPALLLLPQRLLRGNVLVDDLRERLDKRGRVLALESVATDTDSRTADLH